MEATKCLKHLQKTFIIIKARQAYVAVLLYNIYALTDFFCINIKFVAVSVMLESLLIRPSILAIK